MSRRHPRQKVSEDLTSENYSLPKNTEIEISESLTSENNTQSLVNISRAINNLKQFFNELFINKKLNTDTVCERLTKYAPHINLCIQAHGDIAPVKD